MTRGTSPWETFFAESAQLGMCRASWPGSRVFLHTPTPVSGPSFLLAEAVQTGHSLSLSLPHVCARTCTRTHAILTDLMGGLCVDWKMMVHKREDEVCSLSSAEGNITRSSKRWPTGGHFCPTSGHLAKSGDALIVTVLGGATGP